ncbi:MAG: TRAP transporter small permease, partial [Promethearchaeota archaeon]
MGLSEVNTSIESRLARLARFLNIIGLGFIIIMILLTVADVIGRRFFNHSLYGAHELQQFCLMIAAFLTLASCQIARQNITIDFIAELLSRKVMA